MFSRFCGIKSFILLLLMIIPGVGFCEVPQELPRGFGDVVLGLSVDDAKNALLAEPLFGYRGDRDVSLLPGENRTLISTAGRFFFGDCWFQFDNDFLYIITINLNREQIDYFSIFSTLSQKYGDPDSITPQKAEWKNDSVIMSLEKPLTLKYTDRTVFDALQDSSNVQLSAEEYSRNSFLERL